MKMFLSLATLAFMLSALSGCQSCDRDPGCEDDRMLGLGMFQKKHFGFGKKDCDACSVGAGPMLNGSIGQASGCGCGNQTVAMPVQQSGCGCGNATNSQHMPVSMSNDGALSGYPAGTIMTESVPTPTPATGGTFRGSNPDLGIPGPG